jgi:hypothetical protein
VQVKKEFNDDDEESAYVPGRRDMRFKISIAYCI